MPKKAGRLALRVEGDKWVAYYANVGTMDGAIWLGSVNMAMVEKVERREAFMNFMKEGVSDLVLESFGERPTWPDPPVLASEHEK